jgi:hypothetical protein
MLFYEQSLYRETAVCVSQSCFALQINSDIILQLGNDHFMNRGQNAEAMKQDMEILFERISHIYNRKERWRIMIAQKENQFVRENDT